MLGFKRNQLEEAIFSVVGRDNVISQESIQTRIKRLLDADRALGRDKNAMQPEQKSYAFYSRDASGSGTEISFSAYEVFAMLVALNLLDHGFPQQKCVQLLRRIRTVLSKAHVAILKKRPEELFDKEAVAAAAKPGAIAASNTDPVYLAIASRSTREPDKRYQDVTGAQVCNSDAAVMTCIKDNGAAGQMTTCVEIVTLAHRLQHDLSKTKPRRRGRA